MDGRNLVVCCDGTNNEIGALLSNVLKLYRIAEKSGRQLVYYSPGIGTIAMPKTWGKWRARARATFEMMTGWGLDRDVLAAYCFLCQNYREGDRIFLFGFSRGAYTVRVVAGMLYLVGLLREHQVNFAGYALKAYKSAKAEDRYLSAREFSDTVRPQIVAVHFLGVWDSVASVIVPGATPVSDPQLEELPYTSDNPAVATFRHAISIDERRRMFRIMRWIEGQVFKPNRHSQAKTSPRQDCRQVWFAGSHSDVGGGYREEESALSKYPLLWMLEQAKSHGLVLRTQMVNHMVRGAERPNARNYVKPSSTGKAHRTLAWLWLVLEVFPKSNSLRDWPRRLSILGYYIPWGEPRKIPEGSLVDTSVIERKRKLGFKYRPRNFPADLEVETMNGPLVTTIKQPLRRNIKSGSGP